MNRNNLILPQSALPAQPLVQPGITIQAHHDGPSVVIQVLSNIVLPPDQARQLLGVLAQSIQQAEQFGQAIAFTLNGNGSTPKV